ncbi:Rad1/Rec1/Rad17 [Phytophthora cactorum]|nr:Rad1/Rec1/Rad17 [Phytophthora cactorum]
MFGPSALATTSLRMTYEPESASLLLVVEDSGVMCECSMQVLEHEGGDMGQLEFETAFEQSAVVARCIMQSEPLRDAFAELYDLPSAASVTIAMADADSRALKIGRKRTRRRKRGRARSTLHLRRRHLSIFLCPSSEGDYGGSFAVLQQAFKALAHSNETFLRMNGDGFLSIQHMIESGSGDKAFVDALISPEDTSICRDALESVGDASPTLLSINGRNEEDPKDEDQHMRGWKNWSRAYWLRRERTSLMTLSLILYLSEIKKREALEKREDAPWVIAELPTQTPPLHMLRLRPFKSRSGVRFCNW